MLSKPVIKFLISKYLVDGEVLFRNRRYSAAIYLTGYAIELALKYRICTMLLFAQGFPETKYEFDNYFSDKRRNKLRRQVSNINDIRNHKLPILLQHSGEQYNIETNFHHEWNVVQGWRAEIRYRKTSMSKTACQSFLQSARLIVTEVI